MKLELPWVVIPWIALACGAEPAGPPKTVVVPSSGASTPAPSSSSADVTKGPKGLEGDSFGVGLFGDAGVDPNAARGSMEGLDAGWRARAEGPRVLQGPTQVSGRLATEIVQRVVRQNLGRFLLCYKAGLEKNAALTGTIATRFTIDEKGDVTTSADAGGGATTMPDATVVACVTKKYQGISFPTPETGKVVVVFSFTFSPSP